MTAAPAARTNQGNTAELEELGRGLLSAATARRPNNWLGRIARFRQLAAQLATPLEQATAHLRLADYLQARANARDGIKASLEAEREARTAIRLTEGLGVRLRLDALNDLANILHDRADRRLDMPAAKEAEKVFDTALAEATEVGDIAALADLKNNAAGIYSERHRRRGSAGDLQRALGLYREARALFVRINRIQRFKAKIDNEPPFPISYRQRWANTANNALNLEAEQSKAELDRTGLLRITRRKRRVMRIIEADAANDQNSPTAREEARSTAANIRYYLGIDLSVVSELRYDPDLQAEAKALWARNHDVWTREKSERDWARLANSEISHLLTLASIERNPQLFRDALARFAELADLPSFPAEKEARRRPWTFRSAPENYVHVALNAARLREDLASLELDRTYLDDAHMDLDRLLGRLRRHPGLLRDKVMERLGSVKVALSVLLQDGSMCENGLELHRQLAREAKGIQPKAAVAAISIYLAQVLQNAWSGFHRPELLMEAAEVLEYLRQLLATIDHPEVRAEFETTWMRMRVYEALHHRDSASLATLATELRAARQSRPATATPEIMGDIAALELEAVAGSAWTTTDPARWEAVLPHLDELRTIFATDTPKMLDAGRCIGEIHRRLGRGLAAIREWDTIQAGLWPRMVQAEGHGARRSLLDKVSHLDPFAGPMSPSLGDALALALLDLPDSSGALRALQAVARGRSLLRAAHRSVDLPRGITAGLDRLRRTEALAAAATNPPPSDAASLMVLRKARAEADAARAAFFGMLPANGLAEAPQADINRICEALGDRSALVVVFASEVQSAAIVLHCIRSVPSLSTLRFPTLGLDRLCAMGSELEACMSTIEPGGQAFRDAEVHIEASCRFLGKAFADVLVAHLGQVDVPAGTELLLMVPGILAAQPLHAAWLGEDRNCPLLASYPVRYTQFLPDPLHASPGSRTSGSLLMVTEPAGKTPDDEWSDPPLHLDPGTGQVRHLHGRRAKRNAVLKELANADVFVFEGHGKFDPLRPERSHLVLAGSDLLTLADLGAVASNRRRLCVLTACEGARLDTRRLSDEFVGLATALLDCGFEEVVASTWPVKRTAAQALIRDFWKAFRQPDGPELGASSALSIAQSAQLSGAAPSGSIPILLRVGDSSTMPDGAEHLNDASPVWWAGFRVLSAR